MLSKLDATSIRAQLTASAAEAVRGIHIFPALDSTNRWALQEGQCGDVCLAEQQTAGRGRRGRQWQSPQGVNLYLSLRWCFTAVPEHLPLLSLVTGLAVAEALQDLGMRGHGVKWPNDIVFSSPLAGEGLGMGGQAPIQKLGGILLEAVGSLQQVVIGIGLNVNMLPNNLDAIDQPWTSLQQIQGKPWERNQVSAVILSRLLSRLQVFSALDMAQFHRDWQRWDVLLDTPVRVLAGGASIAGVAAGVDTQGQLRLELTDGLIKVFSSADVSVRM